MKKIEVTDLVSWTFTAFFHDLGYGIQELQGLYSEIEKQYQSIGDITLSKFTFTESTRIFAEKIVDLMNELVVPTRFPYEGYIFMRLSPILQSLKEYKHGLISAILFLKSIDETIMKNYNFFLSFPNQWENIFLRFALAMSVHTYPPHLTRGLDIDLHLPKYKGRISDPLNPAFILCLFDSIEYLERPKFNRFDALPEQILVHDVKMSMKISFSYSINHFVNLDITLRYTSETDIIEVGKKIRDRFTGFNSSKWGVVITLIDKNDRKFKFSILRKELEDFLKFKESKQLQTINSYDDILRAYISFISSTAEVNGLDKKEVEYWKPRRVSFQILDYINKKEYFRSHFY